MQAGLPDGGAVGGPEGAARTAGTGGRSWVILLGILASRRSNLRIAPVR